GSLSGATPGERVDSPRTARDPCCAPAQTWSRLTGPVGTPRRFPMSARRSAARNLAAAFLSGPRTFAELIERGTRAWGPDPDGLAGRARAVLPRFGGAGVHPDASPLARFLEGCRSFATAWNALPAGYWPLRELFILPPRMAPRGPAATSWGLP